MIRVMIVDDHEVIRYGLGLLVSQEDDLELVAVACDGSTALDLVERTCPDVVVMDLRMPGPCAVTTARRILEQHVGTKVLFLTAYEASFVRRAGGVLERCQVMTKDHCAREVVSAIRSAFANPN